MVKILEKNWFYITLLALFLIVSFFDLIKGLDSYTFGHDLGINWNYWYYIKKSFWEFGQVPLWNNYLLSGYPLASSNVAALFYPFNYLLLILPLKIGFNILVLLHVYLIGTFTYLLAHYGFRLTKAASFIAGLSFMLTPKIFNHLYLGHFNPIESLTWLPLALLLFIKAMQRRSLYLAVSSGLSLAFMVVVFSVFYIYALFAIVIYVLVQIVSNFWEERRILMSLKLLIYPLTAIWSSWLFSAVFLIPFLNFASQTQRANLSFWEGVFPSIYRDTLQQLFFIFPHRFHDSETLIYLGLPTLLLGILGFLVSKKQKEGWFLFLSALFALTVSFGANEVFYKIYYRLIPIFQLLRAPLRIWVLFALSVSLLAGLGIDYLLNRVFRRRMLISLTATALIFISLWVYNRDYLKFVDFEQPFSNTEKKIYDLISNGNYRIYCLTNCLQGPEGLRRNVELANGNEATILESYSEFMRLAGGFEFKGHSISIPPYQVFDTQGIYFEEQNPSPGLLGLTSSRYLVSPSQLKKEELKLIREEDGFYIYENLAVLPRAFIVPNSKTLTSLEDLRKGNFRKEVYLPNFPEEENRGGFQEVKIDLYSPNKISLNFNLESKAFLVLSDLYYPGWRAFDSGVEVPILRANGIFRAIHLKPGNHKILFEYFPTSLKLGLLISTFSLSLFIAWSYWRNRRSAPVKLLLEPGQRRPSS